jgi:hypothetical protein
MPTKEENTAAAVAHWRKVYDVHGRVEDCPGCERQRLMDWYRQQYCGGLQDRIERELAETGSFEAVLPLPGTPYIYRACAEPPASAGAGSADLLAAVREIARGS